MTKIKKLTLSKKQMKSVVGGQTKTVRVCCHGINWGYSEDCYFEFTYEGTVDKCASMIDANCTGSMDGYVYGYCV